MNKKKILFLIGAYMVGGKERQLTEIIKNLPNDEFEIFLFAKYIDAYYLSDENKKSIHTIYALNKSNFELSDILRLRKFISEVNPDIVFSFSDILGHFSLIIKPFIKKPFILINGSIRDAPRIFDFDKRLQKVLYSLYKYVVANSYAGLEAYGQKGKKGRFVLYNGFNFARIPAISKQQAREKLNLPDNIFVVVMVAAIANRKDHITFIKAAHECMNRDNGIHFYVVGNGPEKENLEKYAQSLNVKNNLYFWGERRDIEIILRAADLSVLTSAKEHGEGISNSIMESLACGTPVIATDNGGTKEIILNDQNGYLVSIEDSQTVADKILFLKQNPAMLDTFSKNGISLIKEEFSIEKMIANFKAILRQV